MTRRRHPNNEEMNRLAAVGRQYRRAIAPADQQRVGEEVVQVATALKTSGVTWKTCCTHLGISTAHLLRLRRKKNPIIPDDFVEAVARCLYNIGFELTSGRVSAAGEPGDTTSPSPAFSAADLTELATPQRAKASEAVVIAIGFEDPDSPQPDRDRFRQEAKGIQRAARPLPVSPRYGVTPVQLQDLALRRPQILHVAAHRIGGVTMLTDLHDNEQPVTDESLAKLLAPEEGSPNVLVLSFCDSYQVAAQIEHLDITVVSFAGTIDEDAAKTFRDGLYEALALGRTPRHSFEVGRSITRDAHGVEPIINHHSSHHDRPIAP